MPDESLLRLVKAAAADEWAFLSVEIIKKNEAILQSLGMTNSEGQINTIFNDVAESILSDNVLNRAVELLKEMGQQAR